MLPNSIDRQRTRRQPTGARWKRPEKWFHFVIAAFSLNLFIAIVTVERHINFSSSQATTSLKNDFMDRPRISPLSSRWKETSKPQFSTESRLWHRMLLQQEQNNGTSRQHLCNKNQTSTKPLPPFGFSETVRAYVHENESSKKGYCHAPPSEPSCQSLQYTVVIYSNGNNGNGVESSNRYWRNIVVWAMKFLANPSVQRVNLILRDEQPHNNNTLAVTKRRISDNYISDRNSTPENFANRNKYAKRVLHWSKKGVVNVVSASSLWDAIDRLEVPSESALWINGDHSVDLQSHVSNDTALNHRFHTWRETPNALMIPEETSLIPLKTIGESVCSFPLLHEMMMHTNYHCYLNHPVVGSELRNYTKSVKRQINANDRIQNAYDNSNDLEWDITTVAVGMLLFSIGDGYVISDASTATNFASNSLMTLHSAGDDALATYTEDISNYFGCPCSMVVPRLSPSNKRHCSSG